MLKLNHIFVIYIQLRCLFFLKLNVIIFCLFDQNPVIFLYSSSCSKFPLILLKRSSLILVWTMDLPFGKSSSTKSSRLILSRPLVLMISMQWTLSWSFHPHSTTLWRRYSSSLSFSPLSSSFFSIKLFLTAISWFYYEFIFKLLSIYFLFN